MNKSIVQQKTIILIILLFLSPLLSCATKHIKKQKEPALTIEDILSKIESKNTSYNTLKGYGKIKIKIPAKDKTKKLNLNISLSIKGEDSLRLEVLNFFNQPTYYLLIHNKEIISLDPINRKGFKAKFTSNNLKKIAYADIDLNLWIKILTNKLLRGINFKTTTIKKDKINYILESNDLRITASKETFLIRELMQVNSKIAIKYNDFKKIENNYFPFKINYADHKKGVEVNTLFFEVILDDEVPDTHFSLQIPSGYNITVLD